MRLLYWSVQVLNISKVAKTTGAAGAKMFVGLFCNQLVDNNQQEDTHTSLIPLFTETFWAAHEPPK